MILSRSRYFAVSRKGALLNSFMGFSSASLASADEPMPASIEVDI
jgi:hypothetical protein